MDNLIPRAGRTNGGFGLFDRDAIERLSIIHAARETGLPLQAIRPLPHALNAKDATAVATNIEEVELLLSVLLASEATRPDVCLELPLMAISSAPREEDPACGGAYTPDQASSNHLGVRGPVDRRHGPLRLQLGQ